MMQFLNRTVILLLLQLFFFNCFAQNLSRKERIFIEKTFNLLGNAGVPILTIDYMNKVLRIDSVNLNAIAYRAIAYEQSGDYERALKDFDLFMNSKPFSSFCVYRGRLKAKMGDTAAAIQDFDRAMVLSNYDPDVCNEISYVLKLNEQMGVYFEELIKRHPNTAVAYYVTGILKEKKDDYRGATQKYAQAITELYNNPFAGRVENKGVYVLKAYGDYKLGRYKQAIEAISEAILLTPDNRKFYKDRIIYYRSAGMQIEACEDMMTLQSLDPTYMPFIRISCDSSKTKKIVSNTRQNELDAERFYCLGYASKGDDSLKINQALHYFSKAIELRPDHIYALASRGVYYLALHQSNNAIADYDKILRINPKCALAYHFRAEAYRALDNYQEAIKDETEAIRLDSSNVKFRVKKAALLTDIGDTLMAIKELSKCLKYNSSYPDIYLQRGILNLYNQKNYVAALEDFTKAIDLKESMPLERRASHYYSFCAEAYDKLLMYNEALTSIDKAIAIDPDHSYYYYFSGEIKARMKDRNGACEDWHTAKKLGYEKAEEVLLYNCE